MTRMFKTTFTVQTRRGDDGIWGAWTTSYESKTADSAMEDFSLAMSSANSLGVPAQVRLVECEINTYRPWKVLRFWSNVRH